VRVETTRKDLGGGCVAWYPAGAEQDEALLVWMAPADGAWSVYLEGLPGDVRRREGIASAAEAEAVAVALLAGT
jgi:hypothetical protein